MTVTRGGWGRGSKIPNFCGRHIWTPPKRAFYRQKHLVDLAMLLKQGLFLMELLKSALSPSRRFTMFFWVWELIISPSSPLSQLCRQVRGKRLSQGPPSLSRRRRSCRLLADGAERRGGRTAVFRCRCGSCSCSLLSSVSPPLDSLSLSLSLYPTAKKRMRTRRGREWETHRPHRGFPVLLVDCSLY